jgi:RNA polymerase sigma-70 factor (ECF subfamily)
LINRAKTRGTREARTVPLPETDDGDAAAPPRDPFDDRGRWRVCPERWDADTPKHCLLRKELSGAIEAAIRCLPERQRTVVVLRDALGWSAHEVCNVLDVHETNQRVLLHRARSRLRAILEHYQGGLDDVELSRYDRAADRLVRRRADAG